MDKRIEIFNDIKEDLIPDLRSLSSTEFFKGLKLIKKAVLLNLYRNVKLKKYEIQHLTGLNWYSIHSEIESAKSLLSINDELFMKIYNSIKKYCD